VNINKNIIIVILTIAIMLFIFFNIWEKHPSVVDSHVKEIQKLENEIFKWDSIATRQILISDNLQKSIDSLIVKNKTIANSKVKVKHIYHEIYKDIPNASNSKLDSIIRSSW
jgi:hypothetical protein